MLKDDIIDPLKDERIVADIPKVFEDGVDKDRDHVRNAFAHGRWTELKAATDHIDLREAFGSVVGYLAHVEEKLRENRVIS